VSLLLEVAQEHLADFSADGHGTAILTAFLGLFNRGAAEGKRKGKR
jgi:hypothetical protein